MTETRLIVSTPKGELLGKWMPGRIDIERLRWLQTQIYEPDGFRFLGDYNRGYVIPPEVVKQSIFCYEERPVKGT